MAYLVKSIAVPLIWIVGLLILGLAFLAWRRKRWMVRLGWTCAVVGTLLLLTLSIPLVADLLLYSLECRHTPPSAEVLLTLDTVVVLPANSRCQSLRLLNGIRTFQQSSARMLALPVARSQPESECAAQNPKTVAEQMGVPQTQIIVQALTHNTMEDAIEARRLIPTESERRIGLVTCALHMPRAKWAFKELFPHDTVVPIPVGRRCAKPSFRAETVVPSVEAFHNSTRALHEWLGLLWYSLRYAQTGGE
ncbi:MAG: YdcF family protein [Phycisphaerales bacterium]|nr:MAG: YdcF family protein [Phycisphaerales bacterium]